MVGFVNLAKAADAQFTPNISIPGSEFKKGVTMQVEGNLVGEYIAALYKFFVGIAGILAVVMITFGGVLWLFSGGSAEKIGKAKEIIFGAVIGLGLALGSYMLLNIINPRLVDFSKIIIDPISRLELSIHSGCCYMTDKQSALLFFDSLARDYHVSEKMLDEFGCARMLGRTLNAYSYLSYITLPGGITIPRQVEFKVDEVKFFADDPEGVFTWEVGAWDIDKGGMSCFKKWSSAPSYPTPNLEEDVCCQFQNQCRIIPYRECRGINEAIDFSVDEYECVENECVEKE